MDLVHSLGKVPLRWTEVLSHGHLAARRGDSAVPTLPPLDPYRISVSLSAL